VEAYNVKKSSEDYNMAMVLGGLFLAGAAVGLSSNHAPTVNAAEGVMLGSTAIGAAHAIKGSHDQAQYGEAVYSREHILAGGLRIPPELSIRRQLVINHPDAKPKSVEICWEKPESDCSVLSL
jgi:hypothetical protein